MLFSPCFLTSLHLEERSITTKCKTFEHQGDPIVSVDCKKKELIGQFKNNGREWMPEGQTTAANVYDFQSQADHGEWNYTIHPQSSSLRVG